MGEMQADVLVIGGNPGGCSAAIAAARSGASVILLEPTKVLGGMNANGTFGFDCATPQALSGIAEEVAARIREHYGRIGLKDPLFEKRADLVWESHVCAGVWQELANETKGLRVFTRAVPVEVVMHERRIHEVRWQHASDLMGNVERDDPVREVVVASVVIDASYEGDVTAWAGAPYRLGREARSQQEPHAGKIFTNNTELSKDGVLPNSILPGSTGEGDDAIMAFACRLHCRLYDDRSAGATHRVKAPPPAYDPSSYSWGPVAARPDGTPVYFNQLSVLVNSKLLLNRMARGNNLVGPNREYVLAHPRDRKPLRQQFIDRSLGYLYFVQTEGGMPELGLAHDEFEDNGNIPYQIYVREARRIEGAVTLTEADVTPFIQGDGRRPPAKADVVAIGDWTVESQGCADVAPEGYKYPDGYITNRMTRTPFQIPYGCLLPKNVDNLLVSGAVSATHVAWGAVRVEAARIHMGIAAGVASGLAVKRKCDPSQVDVDAIQSELVSRGVKLAYFADVESNHLHFAAIQWAALRGYVPPDRDWRFAPDHPIAWGDFAKATVICLGLPISVTGAHFEGISPDDDCFRYVESLYDLGTRAGLDLFSAKKLADEDPMKEFLRLYPGFKLIPFNSQLPIEVGVALRFLEAMSQAGVPSRRQPIEWPAAVQSARSGLLTRGAMCALLRTVWDATNEGFAQKS
jgi:hypothetical protein